MIDTLRRGLHLAVARTLIDESARRAPEEVAITEVIDRHGLDANQLRGQLGALSKLCVKLFDKKTWPMSVRTNEGGYTFYRMPERVAQLWLSDT